MSESFNYNGSKRVEMTAVDPDTLENEPAELDGREGADNFEEKFDGGVTTRFKEAEVAELRKALANVEAEFDGNVTVEIPAGEVAKLKAVRAETLGKDFSKRGEHPVVTRDVTQKDLAA
jgi:hypothetical protein